MRQMKLVLIVVFIALVACNKDSPRHHAKEMIGRYNGSWTFYRTTGEVTESGYLDIEAGSNKNSIIVGPDRIEFELNESLEPIMSGTQYKISFPYGNTEQIVFERYWEGQFGSGSDYFIGNKQK